MTQTRESTQQELIRRHRLALIFIIAAFGTTSVLMIIGFLHKFPLMPFSRNFALVLWVLIAMLGLGTILLRRTLLDTGRLNDIAALRGITGVLTSLQNTTMLLAAIGESIAIMGFVTTMMSNDWIPVRNAGVIAIGVLLYSYPIKSTWQLVVQGIERKGLDEPPPAKEFTK